MCVRYEGESVFCIVSRAIRICVRMSGARARKGGSGKNTYGVNGQVFVR